MNIYRGYTATDTNRISFVETYFSKFINVKISPRNGERAPFISAPCAKRSNCTRLCASGRLPGVAREPIVLHAISLTSAVELFVVRRK